MDEQRRSVLVVEDGTGERHAFATLNEGLGKVLRFGAYDAEVLTRLAWLRDVAGPTLDAVVQRTGPVDTTALLARPSRWAMRVTTATWPPPRC